MWGLVAKVAGWAIAHKSEILAGVQIWKTFRAKRKANQLEGEGTTAYYKRTGLGSVKTAADDAAGDILNDGLIVVHE